MAGKIYAAYFSPTGGTRKIVLEISHVLAETLSAEVEIINLTKANIREDTYHWKFDKDDIVICGSPVYQGRIPLPAADAYTRFRGCQTTTVLILTYGNRGYDDALLMFDDLMCNHGMTSVAAGAFVAQHSLNKNVATGRPDNADLADARQFGRDIARRFRNSRSQNQAMPKIKLPGKRPYRSYQSLNFNDTIAGPECDACGICAQVCPINVIHPEAPNVMEEGCIYCMVCIDACPLDVRYAGNKFLYSLISKGIRLKNGREHKDNQIFQ